MKQLPLLVSLVAAFSVAVIGGLLTTLDEWYFSLVQPSWKPPDWAFGPVWTIIFTLCAFSSSICYKKSNDDRGYRKKIVFFFLINATLNIVWSFLYFFLKRPDIAFIEVIFLWLSILFLIFFTKRKSILASVMLYPYLIWVSLASALNYQTIILNGPFV